MPTDKDRLTRRRKADRAKFTHDAYIFKVEGVRRGKRIGYWEQEGYARTDPDQSIHIQLHSTPIGGFDGRIKCYPYGTEEPPDETGEDEQPQRPGDDEQQPD
jgi:hypothetical protein